MGGKRWLALICESDSCSPDLFGALDVCRIPYAWAGGADRVQTMSILLSEGLASRADGFILLSSDVRLSPDALDRLLSLDAFEEQDCLSGYCDIASNEFGQSPPYPAPGTEGIVRCVWTPTVFCAMRRSVVETARDQMIDAEVTETRKIQNWVPFWLPFVAELEPGNYEYLCPDRAFWWRMTNLAGARLFVDMANQVSRLQSVLLGAPQTND